NEREANALEREAVVGLGIERGADRLGHAEHDQRDEEILREAEAGDGARARPVGAPDPLAVPLDTEPLVALGGGAGGERGRGGALPAPLRVTTLADCAVLPAATGGCP